MESDESPRSKEAFGYEESSENGRHHRLYRRSTPGTDAASTVMVVIAALILIGMVIIIIIIFCKMRKQRERTISPDLPTEMTATTPVSRMQTPARCPTPRIEISPPQSPGNSLSPPPTSTIPVPVSLNYTPQTLQEICEEIESLTRPIVAELKSYTSPPLPVHKTMTAVFMLLGENRKFLNDWNNILILMKANGKESLMWKLSKFTTADNKVVREVRRMIKDMKFEDVRSAGKSVSHLFRWVSKVCDDSAL